MKKWINATIEERETIFKENDFSFPHILAARTWQKLPKIAKDAFKKTTMKQNNTEQKPLPTPLQDKGNGQEPMKLKIENYGRSNFTKVLETHNLSRVAVIDCSAITTIEEANKYFELFASATQLKAENETLAWDVNRLAVDNQQKEDTIKELLEVLKGVVNYFPATTYIKSYKALIKAKQAITKHNQ